jgi:glycopeptide antibiotics resistance protein
MPKQLGRAKGDGTVLDIDPSVLPVLALMAAVPWAGVRLLWRVPVRRAVPEALLAGYALALFCAVTFPLRPLSAESARFTWSYINLVPMRTVFEILRDFHGQVVRQLLGNVVMFTPLGFLLPVLYPRYRRFAATALAALAVSSGIELMQLAMLLSRVSGRSVDVDDVILNVTGACLGYLAWRMAHAAARSFSKQPQAMEEAA